MTICGRRPEGFGPKSLLSSPIPTSCFVDTILIPLPVWLALLILPILLLLGLRIRKTNYNPSTAHFRTGLPRTWGYKSVAAVYYILIVANILMQILEIVRLGMISYGIGLLPFVIVGLLLGGILHWTEGFQGRIKYWQAINGIIWIGGMIMAAVKVVGQCYEGIDTRRGTKYPMEDQVTDTAVIAGVYVIIAILEVILGVWRARPGEKDAEAVSLDSGRAPVMGSQNFGK